MEQVDLLRHPPALHGWIAEEEDTPLQFARYDLFPTDDDRWMVSEFNEDVPGGFNEAVAIRATMFNGPAISARDSSRRSIPMNP